MENEYIQQQINRSHLPQRAKQVMLTYVTRNIERLSDSTLKKVYDELNRNI